jgi:hypothetical protein
VFAEMTKVFAEEVQRRLFPSREREAVSRGRPRVPLSSSSGALSTCACSHGAWPWWGMPARMSEPWRGRLDGVGTLS